MRYRRRRIGPLGLVLDVGMVNQLSREGELTLRYGCISVQELVLPHIRHWVMRILVCPMSSNK